MATRARARYEIGLVDNVSRSLTAIEQRFGAFDVNLKTVIAGVGVAAAGAFGVMAQRVVDAGVKIHDLNIEMGAGVEALSQYRFVAEQSNVQFDLLSESWKKMAIRVSEAVKGEGEAVKVLKELGLEANALSQLAPEEQFEAIAMAMQDIDGAGDRARIATKLFEEQGVSLLKIIDQGPEKIAAMREEADRLGFTLGEQAVKDMAAFDSNMNKVKNAAFGFGQQLVLFLGGPGKGILTWLSETIPEAGTWFLQSIAAFEEQFWRFIAAIRTGDAAIFKFLSNITFGGWKKTLEGQMRAALEDVTKAHLNAGDAALKQADILEGAEAVIGMSAATWENVYTPSLRNATEETNNLKKGTEEVVEEIDLMSRALTLAAQEEEQLEQEAARQFIGIKKAVREGREETEEFSDAARDLGLTFESSLEKAILKTSSFRDILKGLAEDIQKILIRKAVTEPFANAITGFVEPFVANLGIGAAGAAAGAGTPASGNGVMVNINGPVSDAGLVPVIEQAAAEGAARGYQMVLQDVRGGGPLRQIIR